MATAPDGSRKNGTRGFDRRDDYFQVDEPVLSHVRDEEFMWRLPVEMPSVPLAFSLASDQASVTMAKTTRTYWNPLAAEHRSDWTPVEGMERLAEELTLAIDPRSGDYTRLTRFAAGADTTPFGGKSHAYPEEIFILEGSLYDAAFDRWLTKGDYASRPPGEQHGPFRTDEGCLVLEISYPSQSAPE